MAACCRLDCVGVGHHQCAEGGTDMHREMIVQCRD